MYQSELNALAKDCCKEYMAIKDSASVFEPKGIFHSELLMVLALSKKLDITHIVESGRARGQSTEIIARICKRLGIKFDSIEFDRNSPDVPVAESRLKPFENICTLHYGDGFNVMPNLIKEHENTLIIIDGPKGVWGLKLGLNMLRKANVRAVLFHDTHRDASDVRPLLEKFFPNSLLFSDDYEYVEALKHLDVDCWEITESYTGGYGPYRRGNISMRSYAGTLSCVLNDSIQETSLDRCLGDIEKAIRYKNSLLYKIMAKLKIIGAIKRLSERVS